MPAQRRTRGRDISSNGHNRKKVSDRDTQLRKMTAYRLILFDLDGTLTDPKAGITRSVQYALAKFDIHEPNLDDLQPFIGPPLWESFPKYYGFDCDQTRRAVDFYREYFGATGIYENRVYPGIPALLDKLQTGMKQLVVATSKPTGFANQVLGFFGLDRYFALVVGSCMDGTRSSKTEVISHALAKSGVSEIKDAVMIGDHDLDVIGARSNGLDAIAVTYGYGSLPELQRANPTYLVHSVEQLGALIG